MNEFLSRLQASPLLTDGAIGTYIFERTGRLSEMNHVYEAFNLDKPQLVEDVHLAYLRAGAQCIKTNTFAANRSYLDRLGEGQRIDEINRAGARVARRAIERYLEQAAMKEQVFVLGSVGQPRDAKASIEEIKEAYRTPVRALAEEGVDAILLETFSSLIHIMSILEVIRALDRPPPVIVNVSPRFSENREQCEPDPEQYIKTMIEWDVPVAGVNCCAPWEASAFIDTVQKLPAVEEGRILLSVVPNAGGFQRIDSRYMSRVNPEFMGSFARSLARRGVRLIGGCCDVHPPHINEMRNFLRSHQVVVHDLGEARVHEGRPPVGPEAKKANGLFSRKLFDGEFVASVEMIPPRGTGPKVTQAKIDFIGELDASGLADALDVTDGSRGIPLMPPGDFIQLARHRLGWAPGAADKLEFIPHFTSRDLNLMGLQSRLMGYGANGIHNVLFITGDPPKMSPTYPRSTAVFDLDSVAMIGYTHRFLNAGVDFGAVPLGKHADPRTHFTIGTGFEPEALDMEHEVEKLRRKIDNGVDYIMTQPTFRHEPLDVLDPYRKQVKVLIGVLILTSLEHAKRVAEVPGVIVPDAIFERLGACEKIEDQAKVGKEIAIEQASWVKRERWSGLYLMSPSTHRPVIEVLKSVMDRKVY